MKTRELEVYDETIGVRIAALRQAHRELYGAGREVAVSYAPGRAEILGNHTDYNEGSTLSANVTANLLTAASKRPDVVVRLRSQDVGGSPVSFDASSGEALIHAKNEPNSPEAWSNYGKGVLWAYREAGYGVGGFDAVLESTIPSGGGLSSSAAFETAVSRLVSHFNGLSVSQLEQVSLCKQAENEYVGAPCGYLDQATVGLAEGWLSISYKPEAEQPFKYATVEADLMRAGKVLIAGYDPNSKHALVDGKYALRRQACKDSVPVLGELLGSPIAALGDVGSSDLEQVRSDLTVRVGRQLANYVTHVVYENERVLAALDALKEERFDRLGELMLESGASALNLYELDEDSPELRFLYDTVAADPDGFGVDGFRNMGGGFNATTLALVGQDGLEDYQNRLGSLYRTKFGRSYQYLHFVPAPAARIIEE